MEVDWESIRLFLAALYVLGGVIAGAILSSKPDDFGPT